MYSLIGVLISFKTMVQSKCLITISKVLSPDKGKFSLGVKEVLEQFGKMKVVN